MKFSSVVLFAAGALAVQPTIVERQSASTLDSDITAISSAAAALDTAIKGISSASDTPAVVSASDAVVSAIKSATSVASAIPSLSQADAINLVNPIQNLGNIVTTAVNDLIAKKSLIASFGLCGTVLSQVQAQQAAATSFQNTLIPKVPADLQSTAQSLAAPIISELTDAANAFKSCPASSASATSSGSSAPTSTGVTSATSSGSSAPTSTCDETSTASVSTPVSTSTCDETSTATATASATWSTSTYCPESSSAATTWTTAPTTWSTWTPVPSASIPVAPTNGTSPSTPAKPSISVLPSSGAEKVAAGFGALVMAALVALF